jgi:hypothetical protein
VSNGFTTGYMTIEVSNMPALADLMIFLGNQNYFWTNDDPSLTNVGVSVTGNSGTAFPIISASFTTTQIRLVVGGETASFTIGVPISYPTGTQDPAAQGSLTISNPGNVAVTMIAGGNETPVAPNSSWYLKIL